MVLEAEFFVQAFVLEWAERGEEIAVAVALHFEVHFITGQE